MITGIEAYFAELHAAREKLEKEAVAEVRRATTVAVEAMMKITPVNEGETVRNYTAAKGRKPSSGTKAPIITTVGPTNQLALGDEPNRAANEAAALAEIAIAVSGDKLETVHITNTVDSGKWALIESGFAPGPPWKSRGPGGQSAVATQAVRASGQGKWK
jgi:hypothetical protein